MSAPSAPRRTAEEVDTQTKDVLDSFSTGSEPLDREFVRVPFGSANSQLNATEIPGYHLHWINDWHPQDADRLKKATQAGYKYVGQTEVETAPLLGAATTDLGGGRVSRTVGTRPSGEPITAFLMKIPLAWWNEHQKTILDHASKVDSAIRRGAVGGKVEGGYNPRNDPIKLS